MTVTEGVCERRENKQFWDTDAHAGIIFSLPMQKQCIVKHVLRGHSKIYKTKVLIENGSLMKVESIAECWSILQYF